MHTGGLGRPSFWKAQAGVWSVYVVMIYATFLPMVPPSAFKTLLMFKSARTVFGFLLSSALRLLYRRVVGVWSLSRIAVAALVGSVLMGSVWTMLGSTFAALLDRQFNWSTALPHFPRDTLDYALTLAAWSGAYCVVKYWLEWQQERERSLQAMASANIAELQLLRYQLNPHFLFNALNSVRASVDEDTGRAQRMITALAEFLRYSLLSGNDELVELREELLAIRNYLAIESARFEEDLEIRYDVEPAAESAPVPPFLVCALVENAVKHGMRSSSKPLCIAIAAHVGRGTLQIEVSNTGSLKHGNNCDGTGTGVRNVRERVLHIYPGQASFALTEAGGWVHARLKLPVRAMRNSGALTGAG